MRLLMVVAVLALAGPAQAVEDVDGSFAKLAEDDQRALINILESKLADARTARLKGLVKQATVYCGEVNAKNRLGAYTGYQKFQFAPSSAGLVFQFGDDLQHTIYKMFCG